MCAVCILDVESFINGLNTMWHQSHAAAGAATVVQ